LGWAILSGSFMGSGTTYGLSNNGTGPNREGIVFSKGEVVGVVEMGLDMDEKIKDC
jgi:hypothetical protein